MGSPATVEALRDAVCLVLRVAREDAPVTRHPVSATLLVALVRQPVRVSVGPIDESTAPFEGAGATEADAVGDVWAKFKAHFHQAAEEAERAYLVSQSLHRGAEQRRDRARCYLGALRDAEDDGTSPFCHAGRDGDCYWRFCPQTRDGEPARSGRNCPQRQHDDA